MAAPSKKRKTPLTRDELFERALAIVDSDGLEALTMRRLAAEVGVEAASLYHHVPNKDALLDGVLVRMRSEIRLPDPIPEDWKDLMQAIWSEYSRLLSAHPNLVSLAGRRVESDPDSGLVFLTQLGFSDDEAVELWQSMMAYTIGFAMFSSAYSMSDTWDLPAGLASRMSEWHDETCNKTIRMILESYDAHRHVGPVPTAPSVVIPTLNEEGYLLRLVDALHAQTLRPREIIVADAGSTDRTVELAREAGCIVVPGGMPAVGRNAGAAIATGEVIVFLDADVVPAPTFIAASLEEFAAGGYAVATSLIDSLEPGAANEFMADAVSLYLQVTKPVSPHALGACIFVQREAHIEVGGFNEEVVLAEDHDYVRRISRIGEFGILKDARLPVSMRRMEESNIVPLAINYVWSEMHALAGKPVYTSPFEYSFGTHGTPAETTEVADKPVIDLSFLREQADEIKTAFDEVSAHGRDRLDRITELAGPAATRAHISAMLDQHDIAVMRRYLRLRAFALRRRLGGS